MLTSGRAEPVVLDDFSTGRTGNLNGLEISVHRGSILDPEVLEGALEGVSRVIHLAAIPSVPRSIANPIASHLANATGTLSVLEAARQRNVKHVVVASSSSVYGANEALPKEEKSWLSPKSPYAVSKLATEGYAVAYLHSYGLQTLAFRFFNVFGPGQAADHPYAAVIPRFISAALSGRALQIEGDGLQTRDFTYVDTVCEALTSASLKMVSSPHAINLAFGTRVSLLELIKEIEDLVGQPVRVEHVADRPGDVRDSQAETSALAALLPNLEPVSLRSGLVNTLEWFRADLAL